MKNTFNFNSKTLFFINISKLCPDIFGYVGKQLDKKALAIFKIHAVINWETNNSTYCLMS